MLGTIFTALLIFLKHFVLILSHIFKRHMLKYGLLPLNVFSICCKKILFNKAKKADSLDGKTFYDHRNNYKLYFKCIIPVY